MNSINEIYNILEKWRERFPNVDCVSVMDFGDELRIRVDWKGGLNYIGAYYTRIIPKDELTYMQDMADIDEHILNAIETEYRKWEVGEE